MRWFSHQCSPSLPGGHAMVSSVAACCVRRTIVNGDDWALFRFLFLATFDLRTRRHFCTLQLLPSFIVLRLVVRKLSCGQTNTLTNKQTYATENIHLSSSVGDQWMFAEIYNWVNNDSNVHYSILLWPLYAIRAGHYIFALWFLLSFFFFLFSSPNLSRRRLNVYHTYFHTWCGLSANFGCRSETCCTLKIGIQYAKKSPFGHHSTTLWGYVFASKACIDNRKKLVKQQYLFHMSW